jgi:uncharacterized protein
VRLVLDTNLVVSGRPKFARYVLRHDAGPIIAAYQAAVEHVADVPRIIACRDPKDDKFLGLAVAGAADAIVTGDDDLLVLHPFRGIEIVRPTAISDRL